MSRYVLASSIALALLACDPSGSKGQHTPPPPTNSLPGSTVTPGGGSTPQNQPQDGGTNGQEGTDGGNQGTPSVELAQRSWGRVEFAKSIINEMGAQAIDFALSASGLAGSQTLVETGSLVEPKSSGADWTYSPTPTDRLNVVLANGRTISFQFHKVTANGEISSGKDFMDGEHELAVTFTSPSDTLEIVSSDVDGKITASLNGTASDDEMGPCKVHSEANGSHFADIEYGSVTRESDVTWSGDLTCGDERATFTDTRKYEFGEGYGHYYETDSRKLHYTWAKGSTVYDLPDGDISTFRNAEGITGYFASGNITRNGVKVGGLATEEHPTDNGTVTTAYVHVEDGRFNLGTEVVVAAE